MLVKRKNGTGFVKYSSTTNNLLTLCDAMIAYTAHTPTMVTTTTANDAQQKTKPRTSGNTHIQQTQRCTAHNTNTAAHCTA
jgi:hypothetical protein